VAELDAKPGDCQILVVDDSPLARQVCESLLRDIGLRRVTSVGRLSDARRAVERDKFDLVICDFHFEHEASNGQELLEEWRRNRTLNYMTVFIMITGESKYQHVAEAIETALDDYLLKPFTANTLAERIALARKRKVALAPVYEAIERRNYDSAIELCEGVLKTESQYRVYAARLCAELYIKVGRASDARRLFNDISKSQALPWARLGLVQMDLDQGDGQRARRVLEALVAEHPEYADAYDVLARSHWEQGDMAAAMNTLKAAVEITPANVLRLQKLGWLAFLCGSDAVARESLDKAFRVGHHSKSFDWHSVILLMMLRFDIADQRDLRRLRDQWLRLIGRDNASRRVANFNEVMEALYAFGTRQIGPGVERLRQLAEQLRKPDCDFEFACDFVALLSRVTSAELVLPDENRWIELVGVRFCTTRSATDVLMALARKNPAYVAAIQRAHTNVAKRCQDAMARLVQGSPKETIDLLFDTGRRTLNAKAIGMARLVAAKHVAEAPELAALDAKIEQFQKMYCAHGVKVGPSMAATQKRIVAGIVIGD